MFCGCRCCDRQHCCCCRHTGCCPSPATPSAAWALIRGVALTCAPAHLRPHLQAATRTAVNASPQPAAPVAKPAAMDTHHLAGWVRRQPLSQQQAAKVLSAYYCCCCCLQHSAVGDHNGGLPQGVRAEQPAGRSTQAATAPPQLLLPLPPLLACTQGYASGAGVLYSSTFRSLWFNEVGHAASSLAHSWQRVHQSKPAQQPCGRSNCAGHSCRAHDCRCPACRLCRWLAASNGSREQ